MKCGAFPEDVAVDRGGTVTIGVTLTVTLQIKCGDLYENKAVQTFNECAVSSKKCVAQRVDEDLFPVDPLYPP